MAQARHPRRSPAVAKQVSLSTVSGVNPLLAMPASAAIHWVKALVGPLLLLPLALQSPPALAGSDLNPDIETMCKGLALINDELGATAAPGSPMGRRMQTELVLSAAQYGALWSLMKLTPTTTCTKLY